MSTTEVTGIEQSPIAAEAAAPLMDNEWARDFSEAMAYAHGYRVDINLSDAASTSSTSVQLKEQTISVQISKQLIEQAEVSEQLDFLGFNVIHELGHVKRYRHYVPTESLPPKERYFSNIVEDIAINFEAATQTRFFADMVAKAYDQYLFPKEYRVKIGDEPRHKQFMEALLLLSMTTPVHRGLRTYDELAEALDAVGCDNLDAAVNEKLGQVVNFTSGERSFNLLEQLRAHGSNLDYAQRVNAHIRKMYDDLYEQDQNDQKQDQPESGEPSENNTEAPEPFDYSNSGGCQHEKHDQPETSQECNDQNNENDDSNNEANSGNSEDDTDEAKPVQGSKEPEDGSTDGQPQGDELDGDNADPNDSKSTLGDLGKQIGSQIADAIDQDKSHPDTEDKATQLSEEQLAKLRQALELNESDFDSFVRTVNKYQGEISLVTELITQLKRERQDNFLAPSHEISTRGHRIHIGKLLGYVASGTDEPRPDIWKTPAFKERLEYDFDGADFYFLCDVSVSMGGDKAEAAAESSVVLSQGIQDASFDNYQDVPPVRIQVQAFGAGEQMLCELTDAPSARDLGRMFASLRSPSSYSTQVSKALQNIEPAENRLSVVLVLSDGQFHDESAAIAEGRRLEEAGAVLVQCIFGDAEVSDLAKTAKRMKIENAADLPTYMFGIMPELVETLRSTHHA